MIVGLRLHAEGCAILLCCAGLKVLSKRCTGTYLCACAAPALERQLQSCTSAFAAPTRVGGDTPSQDAADGERDAPACARRSLLGVTQPNAHPAANVAVNLGHPSVKNIPWRMFAH